ncbi:30S ribosome-binding factor RbfA [Streptomyces radicis]|uniref:Ribosome-binding factor A n=1 Tax=Streptomyces radicis TaxID=1750517 RepID=A0A3A9W0A8_9ACTN|nr:30S ribosome-binding factor RbfA [Streptomyces radicis]RKN06701.1 30S ribosome-binding factor RbfA [Streptomyces radicis]RKN19327.1 30S ribosome-binding factor RbfA [Streptomyces radicis]
MADKARAKRLADLIREVVAEKLHRDIKDPRLGTRVTITDTRVTGDLREATVFYTVYGDESDREDVAAGLRSAKGVLRSAVGAAAGVKHTPSLEFVPDALPETTRNLDDLFSRARERDEEVRRASTGAEYAGGADPYHVKEDDADDDGGAADGRDRD